MELETDMKKILVLFVCACLIIDGVWFIFHDQPGDSPAVSNEQPSTLYANQAFGFSIMVPAGFTVDESYLNQNLGPGREIPGVGFNIPGSWTEGTNLSRDSHIAVEELSDVECIPETFLFSPSVESEAIQGKNTFTVASASDAGAGNFYDETVYLKEKGSRCYAVRSFIHSTNIGNYPAGTIKEFDRGLLRGALDSIASSLVLY